MDISTFFEQLGLSKSETDIFVCLYKLWTKPASTIARRVWMERTTVYKILKKMVNENIISETNVKWIKHFFVPDLSILKRHINDKIRKYEQLNTNYENIEREFKQLDTFRSNSIPKITIFDWLDGIGNLYKDILENIENNNYISVKLFATNTFESQIDISNKLKKENISFYKELKNRRINVDAYIWNWMAVMEEIWLTTNLDNLVDLPVWNSAVNIFVVWTVVYIIIFKETDIWIKLDSEQLADSLHFILENVRFV